MADIAQIGFSADTSALQDAKQKLEQLSPAAGKAERSAQRLAKVMGDAAGAATAGARAVLAQANANLSAARASDKATAEEIKLLSAKQRQAKASYDAAKAAQEQARASKLAAAAAGQEANAIEQATIAAKRRASVPLVSAARGGSSGPWGMSSSNDNKSGGGVGSGTDGMLKAQASPSNIAAQFQDIGVTAAMGMNPLLIALQQGTQLSMAFAGGLGGVLSALKMMLGPIAILSIVLTGVVAALLQAVNWTKLAQVALNGFAAALETIGPYAIGAAAALALLYSPQIILGISTVIAWIARMGVAATIAGAQMAAAWLVAMGPVGWVIAGIAAVVAAAIVFRDEITQIFGVDIVGAAKDGINWIIGAFKGGYEGIKASWSMLPAAIGDIFTQVYNGVIQTLEKLINVSIYSINSLVDQLPDWLKPDGGLITYRADFSGMIAETSGAATKVGEIIREEMDKAIGQDYVGAISDSVTGMLSGAADKIRSFSSGLGVSEDSKKKKGGGGKTDAEKFSDLAGDAERTIVALQAEAAAVGMNELAAAKLRKETELLNQARAQGLTLSESERNYLITAAHAMADLEYQTNKAKEALEFAKSATKGFVSDLMSGLQQGKSLWESFGDAALNVLQKIADKILNDVIDALFEMNSVGGSGGIGGLFSSIAGFLFNAKGNAFGNNGVTAFANGGAFTNSVVTKPTAFAFGKGGANLGIMGEKDPEAIMPLKRGPDGSLGVQMHSGGGSGGSVNVSPVFAPTYTVEAGATQEAVQELYKLREQDQSNFPAMVASAVNNVRQRNGEI